jgi:hypothetical protein
MRLSVQCSIYWEQLAKPISNDLGLDYNRMDAVPPALLSLDANPNQANELSGFHDSMPPPTMSCHNETELPNESEFRHSGALLL